MDNDVYSGFLKRLEEYRNKYDVSQEMMGKILGITQSHYSKVEQGKKLVSYSSLFLMQKKKMDIDYILTGIRYRESVLDNYIRECQSDRQADMLAHIIWVIKQGVRIQKKQMPVNRKVDYNKIVAFLQIRTDGIAREDTVWKCVRKLDGETQKEMAEKLNVGIKKYREVEKGNAEPDAKILSELYDKSGYFPSIMMPELTINLSYLNDIWFSFDKKLQGELLKHIEDGFNLINMTNS